MSAEKGSSNYLISSLFMTVLFQGLWRPVGGVKEGAREPWWHRAPCLLAGLVLTLVVEGNGQAGLCEVHVWVDQFHRQQAWHRGKVGSIFTRSCHEADLSSLLQPEALVGVPQGAVGGDPGTGVHREHCGTEPVGL